MMNGLKQSDPAILPLRAANKGTSVPAESMEGRTGASPRAVGGDDGSTRSRKGVEHDPAAARAIENGVLDHGDWFDCRVHGQLGVPIVAEYVDPGIVPDVRAVAPVGAEVDIVDVRPGPGLEYRDELVLGPIEGAHPAVRLVRHRSAWKLALP